ncbi:MAG: ABC transporter substrate-binding protein [Acidimicrobiales bacterium]|nr:ABC transporter substrate-binding protein [Acidimicrobiales bacterium]
MTNPSHRRRFWGLAVLLVLALIAVSCGDDSTEADESDSTTTAPSDDGGDGGDGGGDDGDDGDPGSESSTTAPVELTASWTGVTEEVIRLGFTTSDLIQLKALGLVDIDRGDPQVVLDALIDDINDRGGIHGRMIEGYLEVLLPIDATAADESCIRLTEDIGVFAVLAPFVGPNTELNPCINSRNETIIIGGQPTAEQLEVSAAPWISNTMFASRRLAGVIELMEAEGLLGDTVGLVVRSEETGASDDIVKPALEALDKRVVEVLNDSEPGDVLAGEAQWERFIEVFKTEDVDSVVMIENTATFGSTQLARSDLDANYLIVDSTALLRGLGALDGAVPADLAGIIGSAGASEEESWELPATQECVRIFEEAHPDITVVPTTEVSEGESDWFGNINIFCPVLQLFELAANAAGPNLTHETFLAGVESLGEIEIHGQVFASLGPGKYDASDAIRLTVFDETVGTVGGEAPYGPLTAVG